ncbi:MAG: glutathione S-transferase [Gammaproteobacteria bacterium]|nr:glutathione S-transferase [Gammaproteobacteria bacterium]
MKLYGSVTSPFVRHCRIALIQSGLDWELVEIDAAVSGEKSPTKKVPFLKDGDVNLTDSCSILKYAREKSGNTFFPDVQDYDLFCMTNTAIDASINLFLLQNDGLDVTQGKYFGRQAGRVESALDALDAVVANSEPELTDGVIRLACFLEWGSFRNRFSLDSRPNLKKIVDFANKDSAFQSTAIPQ